MAQGGNIRGLEHILQTKRYHICLLFLSQRHCGEEAMQGFIPFRSPWPSMIATNLDIAEKSQKHPKDMTDECHDLSTTTFLIHHGINDDATDIFLDACASLHFLISFHFLYPFMLRLQR